MKLYELKFEINPDDKEKIIRGFGLEYSRQYTDIDHFIETKNNTKLKYKEVEGRTIKYILDFNEQTGLFEIEDEELTENFAKIQEIKRMKVIKVMGRTKEVYLWPGKKVRVSFDSINEIKDKLFCEIYDKDEAAVFEAKGKMVEFGFTRFINKTYDELITKTYSIINLLIIIVIMAVIAFIAYNIIK